MTKHTFDQRYTEAYENLLKSSWSPEQAKMRAGVIAKADFAAKSAAKCSGLLPGDMVACRTLTGEVGIREVDAEGRLKQGANEYLAIVSLPCRTHREAASGDDDTCVLANGDTFRRRMFGGSWCWTNDAGERVKLADEMIARTPNK
jgi:hypothetical protein